MYAIVNISGKQHRVEEGKFIKTEKIEGEPGDKVEFSEVLCVKKDDSLLTGKPYLQNCKVLGQILEQGKENKITVFKYKPKKDYRRKQGHRQLFTKILIEEIRIAD